MIRSVLRSVALILGVWLIANATGETRPEPRSIKTSIGAGMLALYVLTGMAVTQNLPPKNGDWRPREKK